MPKKTRRKFTETQKKQAIQIVASGKSINTTSKELNIGPSTIFRWVKQAKDNPNWNWMLQERKNTTPIGTLFDSPDSSAKTFNETPKKEKKLKEKIIERLEELNRKKTEIDLESNCLKRLLDQ